MANRKQPAMLLHAHLGRWYVKYCCYDRAGRYRRQWFYFTRDKRESQGLYDQQMKHWTDHRARRNAEIRRLPEQRALRMVTVWELYVRFIVSKERERSPFTLRSLRDRLRRFNARYRRVPAAEIRPATLQDFKANLYELVQPKTRRPLSPKTIASEISAIKGMFKYGSSLEMIPAVDFSAVRTPPQGAPQRKGYTPEQVVKAWNKCGDTPVIQWMLLQWLLACRPAETVRIAHRAGDWVKPWLFRPDQAKTTDRHITFCEQALDLLSRVEPRWTRMDSYRTALRRACGLIPHPLRHGAAQCLADQGVDRRDIDLYLGHLPPRTSRIYVPVEYEPLQALGRRLGSSLACRFPPKT